MAATRVGRADVRRAPLSWAAALLLSATLAGCGDEARVTQPTPQPPTVTGGTIVRALSGAWIVAVPLPLTAQGFTASDGSALTYAWSFGDGATASGPSVVHTYQSPGVYAVRVTATTGSGINATATLVGLEVQSVSGRWSLEIPTGRVMVNTALTQEGLDVHGDDTRLNCRFTVTGVLSQPRTLALAYSRRADDCAGYALPMLVVFAGTADDRVNVFTGVTNTGEPAILSRCTQPGC